MLLALAAPAWAAPALAAQRVFLVGELRTEIPEDGVERKALVLEDGTILTKTKQHSAEMAEVGEIPGRGKAFDWLDTPERVKALEDKKNASLLGKAYDKIPAEVADYILEVNVPGPPDEFGQPTRIREKVAKAKADGVDVDKLEKVKPHEWQGGK